MYPAVRIVEIVSYSHLILFSLVLVLIRLVVE